jgi:hypothetical protein
MAKQARGQGKFKDRLTKAAKDAGLPLEKPASMTIKDQEEKIVEAHGQAALLPPTDNPIKPSAVRGRIMMANFVKPVYSMQKDERRVGLEFSFPLTADHDHILPCAVVEAWEFIQKRGGKKHQLDDDDIPEQTIDIRFVPDDDVELHLTAVPITKATLTIVEEKGKGASLTVIRFSFRVLCEVTKNVCTFADNNFGNVVWIEMGDAQGELE